MKNGVSISDGDGAYRQKQTNKKKPKTIRSWLCSGISIAFDTTGKGRSEISLHTGVIPSLLRLGCDVWRRKMTAANRRFVTFNPPFVFYTEPSERMLNQPGAVSHSDTASRVPIIRLRHCGIPFVIIKGVKRMHWLLRPLLERRVTHKLFTYVVFKLLNTIKFSS